MMFRLVFTLLTAVVFGVSSLAFAKDPFAELRCEAPTCNHAYEYCMARMRHQAMFGNPQIREQDCRKLLEQPAAKQPKPGGSNPRN